MTFALVACATTTIPSTEPATTEPPATATPPPASTPAATPTPIFDASDPSTWLITDTGIGRAEIGAESVADALSPVFVQTDWCEGLEFYGSSGSPPVDFGVITHPGEHGVGGIEIRVPGDIAVTGPVPGSPHTRSGIALGSTLDKLTSAETGGAFETGTENPDYIVPAGSRWILFEVSEAEPFVRGITVTDTVPPTGFCG